MILHSVLEGPLQRCFVRRYAGVLGGDISVHQFSDFPSALSVSACIGRKEQSGNHLLPWQGVTQTSRPRVAFPESESQQPIHSLPLPPHHQEKQLCVDWQGGPRRERKKRQRPTSPLKRQGYPAAQLIEQRFGHLGHK